MEARDTDFLQLLDGRKQFSVPIFQRRYSWEKKHCEKLWDDVLRLGQDRENPSHFLGSIVYIEPKVSNASGVRELHVIDGQQRLTTLTLLLAALSRSIEGQNTDIGITSEELSDYYLNTRKTDELRYKQLLTHHDRDTLIQLLAGNNKGWFRIINQGDRGSLIRLLEDKELPIDASPQLLENYRFFETELNDVNLETVYNGIQKLRVVDIALDRSHDNPQLIFESLNSTGLSLSQADLIRNYVLMGQEPDFQDRLYREYWLPMERSFGNEYTKRFDRFIRDYLTLETRQIPNIRSVYEKFKLYLPTIEDPEILEMTLGDISCYAKHFVNIALLQERDPELQACFKDIQDLRVEVSFPFLLEIYEDYTREKIEKAEIIEILRLVESYVFRRAVCGIPTNSLNKTFAALMTEVSKDNYLESLRGAFLRMTSYRRFPRDHEFKRELLIKDVYNFDRCSYLLRKLESHGYKEPFDAAEYTVEHVMSQNRDLSEAWQEELDENWQEIQEKYLHTIGNLTLTGYNPELSDRSFTEKKHLDPGGFLQSRLRLNDSLIQVGKWDEPAIQNRAEELAEKALKIWISPQ